jgi:hypothetical protein
MVRYTQCEKCHRIIIENTPEEMGWIKIEHKKYLCTWCQIDKTNITMKKHKKIREKRISGIFTTTVVAKPLIITEKSMKGGQNKNE